MAVVQTRYPNYHEAYVNGQVATTETCDIDSGISDDDTPIPFGRAVVQSDESDAGRQDIKLGMHAQRFRGITIMDERLPATAGQMYRKGGEVSIMWRGSLAVTVEEAVAVGQDVTANASTGELSSKAAAAASGGTPAQILVPGARFMSAASANGIAVVRLSGAVPAISA